MKIFRINKRRGPWGLNGLSLFRSIIRAVYSSSAGGDTQQATQYYDTTSSKPQKVKVQWVIDGDTVIVLKSWRKMHIRLDAIDCPEDGQPWGDTAKFGLIKLIGGREVLLEEHGVDRHNRTLATIYVRSKSKPEWY